MDRVDAVVNLAKRRGFVFPSSEIYGGTRSAWDYGPYGVELKENVRRQWWQAVVRQRDDIVGLDGSILMNRAVWKASGHEATFSDPMIDCKTCKGRFRADQIGSTPCPQKPSKMVQACGGELTEPRQFNLMFKTMEHLQSFYF